MELSLASIGIFTTGMIVQLFLLLNLAEITGKVIKDFVLVLIGSVLVTLLIGGADSLATFLAIYCVCVSVITAWVFKDRIVPVINEITLVLINLVTMYLLFRQHYEWPFLAAFGLFSLISIANAIIPTKPLQPLKLLFFVWYFILAILMALTQLALPTIIHLIILIFSIITLAGSLLIYDEITDIDVTTGDRLVRFALHLAVFALMAGIIYFYARYQINFNSVIEEFNTFFTTFNLSLSGLFSLGMTFGLIMTNMTYIGGLIPMQGKHETRASALNTVRENIRFLMARYNDAQLTPLQGLALIAGITGLLCLNAYFHYVSDTLIITLTLLIGSGANYYFFQHAKAEVAKLDVNFVNPEGI